MPRSIITPLSLTEYQAIVSGIPTYCPKATFIIAGQTYTASQAVTFVSSVLDAVSATSTAKSAWKDARMAEEKAVAQNGPAVRAIRDVIAAMFSNSTTTLTAFAIAPKKTRTPLTAAAIAAAAAKAKATRLARGTTSKKQKAAITGNVTGVTITPTTAPESVPAATTPAAPAPVNTTAATTSPTVTPAAPAPVNTAPAASAPASPAPAAPPPVVHAPGVTPPVVNPPVTAPVPTGTPAAQPPATPVTTSSVPAATAAAPIA